MTDHPVIESARELFSSDHITVWAAIVVAVCTSEKTLVFLGICFTLLRMWVTWRNRNRPPKE